MKLLRVSSCLAPGPSSSLLLAEADMEPLPRTRTMAEVAVTARWLAAPGARGGGCEKFRDKLYLPQAVQSS